MIKKFLVKQGQGGVRLDLFLSLQMDQFTRSFIKKQINDNRVKVNGDIEYRGRPRKKMKWLLILRIYQRKKT